jgi:hypothetical protein
MAEHSGPGELAVEDVAEAIIALNRAGWSIGDAAFVGASGERVWIVSGRNGENLIRAEGATEAEPWRRAVARAREVGMLRRGSGEELPFTLS